MIEDIDRGVIDRFLVSPVVRGLADHRAGSSQRRADHRRSSR